MDLVTPLTNYGGWGLSAILIGGICSLWKAYVNSQNRHRQEYTDLVKRYEERLSALESVLRGVAVTLQQNSTLLEKLFDIFVETRRQP